MHTNSNRTFFLAIVPVLYLSSPMHVQISNLNSSTPLASTPKIKPSSTAGFFAFCALPPPVALDTLPPIFAPAALEKLPAVFAPVALEKLPAVLDTGGGLVAATLAGRLSGALAVVVVAVEVFVAVLDTGGLVAATLTGRLGAAAFAGARFAPIAVAGRR